MLLLGAFEYVQFLKFSHLSSWLGSIPIDAWALPNWVLALYPATERAVHLRILLCKLLSPSTTLQSGWFVIFHILISFTIFSNHIFASRLVQFIIGILKYFSIKSLTIYIVLLNLCQWSTLLSVPTIMSQEELEIEENIFWLALLYFLLRHKELKIIYIQGNIKSDYTLTCQSYHQHFLPNLLTLCAPLAICYNIVKRISDRLNIFDLEVDINQLCPINLLQICLMENLWCFQKLKYFGPQFGPSLLFVMPQKSLTNHNWAKYLAYRLKQVWMLSFMQSQGQLLSGNIVYYYYLLLIVLSLSEH